MKKAQLNSIKAPSESTSPFDENVSDNEQEERNSDGNSQSASLPPILQDLSANMKALAENDMSKVSAITRVNAIRSKLYLKEEFYSIHGKICKLDILILGLIEKDQLEVIAGEISSALAHLGNFESMISTEMMVSF